MPDDKLAEEAQALRELIREAHEARKDLAREMRDMVPLLNKLATTTHELIHQDLQEIILEETNRELEIFKADLVETLKTVAEQTQGVMRRVTKPMWAQFEVMASMLQGLERSGLLPILMNADPEQLKALLALSREELAGAQRIVEGEEPLFYIPPRMSQPEEEPDA